MDLAILKYVLINARLSDQTVCWFESQVDLCACRENISVLAFFVYLRVCLKDRQNVSNATISCSKHSLFLLLWTCFKWWPNKTDDNLMKNQSLGFVNFLFEFLVLFFFGFVWFCFLVWVLNVLSYWFWIKTYSLFLVCSWFCLLVYRPSYGLPLLLFLPLFVLLVLSCLFISCLFFVLSV